MAITYLQTTHPPISNSGALSTLVNRIMIGLTIEDSLPLLALSLQFRQSQLLSGTHCKPKQAAIDTQKYHNINISQSVYLKNRAAVSATVRS